VSLFFFFRAKTFGDGPPPWIYGDRVVLVDVMLTAANLSNVSLSDSDLEGSAAE
jgi:uncharacterized protein YjbI with pentapeptide repeats